MELRGILFLAILSFLMGFCLALVISMLWRRTRPPAEKDRLLLKEIKTPAETPAVAEALPQPPAVAPPEPGMLKAADLWQNPKTGQTMVMIDGQTAHSLDQLNPAQRGHLKDILARLTAWFREAPKAMEISPATSFQMDDRPAHEAIIPMPGAPPLPPPIVSEVSRSVYQSAASTSATSLPSRPESKSDDSALPRPVVEEPPKRISLLGLLVRALEAEVPKIERQLSIAEQVDAILQEKVDASPFADEGVSLFEQMDHTIGVLVGNDKYPGIDQVPNDEIRKLIRESVSEWTRRTMSS